MNNVTKARKTLLPIGEHEEQVWLQQLQEPQSVEWRVLGYAIDKNSKNHLIEHAVQKLILVDMRLNLRYGFSEDFELEKWHLSEESQFTDTLDATSKQIPDLIKAMKTRGWDPESQSPFRVAILQTEQEKYLFIIIHPILEPHINDTTIINFLGANYEALNNHSSCESLNPEYIDITQFYYHDGSNRNIEEKILAEFRASLDDPDVELDDNFFEIGGHSLLATRIIGNLMKNHGIEVSFNDFFKSPSAKALAQCASVIHQSAGLTSSGELVTHETTASCGYPLSFAQQFLWDAHVATGKCAIFNLPFAMRFDGEVNEESFKLAFSDLLIRHTGLRSLFVDDGSGVVQRIIDEKELPNYAWFWGSSEPGNASLASEAAYVFDLSEELPLRIRFFRDEQTGKQVLSFLIHHMIIDEWSLNSLMSELSNAYMARVQGLEPVWAKPALSIHDYAVEQKSRGPSQEDFRYWVEHLQDAAQGLKLTKHEPEQKASVINPIEANWIEIDLGSRAHQAVSALAREHNSSIFSVVYSAIAHALQDAGDLKDLVIGTSASGRDDAKYFDSVGYYTTMVAHRVLFYPEQSFGKLIEDVTETINDSMSHATVPIDMVQRELGFDPNNGLLFDVYAQIHSDNALYGSLQKAQGESVSYQQILPNKTESLFGLHFEIMENVDNEERSLRLIVTYQTARYNAEQVSSIGQKMKKVLTSQN
ncbi:condensation domain-containing protein [Vibrio sp. STUT-A11]|uniref:condensation domain-containing protein n=1 Tax=Vibrio sp. STUT-A11 TaxID=2976236 RepID=UPI0022301D89|nr:condensation domain-containing protein [Vibrio sp. STUT-A11]BDR15151.1 non-ribosomal peptide synthase [Vibrio sp. STUT-A11]